MKIANAHLMKSIEASGFHYELRLSPIIIIMGTWLPTNSSKEKGKNERSIVNYTRTMNFELSGWVVKAVLLVDD